MYGSLTVSEGHIRLRPRDKVNIKDFFHCVRERISMSEYPEANQFPTGDRDDIIERYNTHRQWMIYSEGMLNNATTNTFTDKMKWINWKITLIKFLKYQPRRNGFPLNYVIQNNFNPIIRNNPNFLDDYADRTQLQGRVFTHDAAKVHSYIISLISENNVAEQKVFPYKDNANCLEDLLDLKDFYEGVGENAKSVLAAENNIQELFYAGKKKPRMWWDELEIRLTNVFAIIDKDAGRQVHTDESNMLLLNKNICANFLTTTNITIDMQMSVTPMIMTYSSALTNYRNTVNKIFPN